MREERAVGDLSGEFGRPAARDPVGATRAAAFRSQVIFGNKVSVAADQRLLALGAARIFPFFYHAGEIARIDVPEAGVPTDVSRA